MIEKKTTVELRDLCIGYKTSHSVRCVADHITANISCGQLTCLLGRNGVGKSTLLRTLSGFQPRLGGNITVMGRPLDDYSDRELARTLGVVLTERPDMQHTTVFELVAMGRSPYTGFWGRLTSEDKAVTHTAIQQVGINDLSSRQVSTLSDGERQKVMIAKSLAQQTPIIYLDEPTAFLDYPSKVETLLLLKKLCRESQKTIFLSTHDMELALQVADCLWLMESGGQLHIGKPRQLADEGVLSRFVESAGVTFDAASLTVRVTNRDYFV